MILPLSRDALAAVDAADPLARFRERFHLPDGVIYLDGNSLGPLPKAVVEHLARVTVDEWGAGLIRSWNDAAWFQYPRRLGDKIARLVGAAPGEVVACDTTSINLFKALAAALRLNPGRRAILSESDNFPTDLYMAQGLVEWLGGHHVLRLESHEAILDAIDTQTAVVMLTHVNYRTGRMLDMPGITARAHEHGALVLWDLAHTAGAMPVDLNAAGADLAVGCGYKYLNGGPGAPAFMFVATRHQARFAQPLSGWWGHAQPFAFELTYTPAEGIARALCGTQPILGMAALDCAVDLMLDADFREVRKKSLALTDQFIALVDDRCGRFGATLVTPRSHAERGSQVCVSHPEGYAIMQALIAGGVIGDFRAPDIMRFGFAPLYIRYVDVWDAVDRLTLILETRSWDRPEWKQRRPVT